MASHTPGPWHWNGIATIWNTTGGYKEVPREVIVANVVTDYLDGRHVEPFHVREANAKLIAAAPELLAEARRIHDRLARQIEGPMPLTEREHDDYIRLAAVIAKAEGK